MSRNILDELYDYDLFHLTEIEDTDGAYRAALYRLVKAETKMKKSFPDKRKEVRKEYEGKAKTSCERKMNRVKYSASVYLEELLCIRS